jgi:16S rRNA (cytosine967-C5)-methyltransferase
MFAQAYLNTAQEILRGYMGEEPFSSFLKKYFTINKKFGSRDRKHITHLCYCFFRLGKSLESIPVSQRIILGLFLCNDLKTVLLQKLDPNKNEKAEENLEQKLKWVKAEYKFKEEDIFPYSEFLSDKVEHKDFSKSFLIQPQVYLRIRPGKEARIKEKLSKANIHFHSLTECIITIDQATKLNEILEINKEAVVQDYNSQQTVNLLLQHVPGSEIKTAWDCCAASGGKSILLKDFFPAVELTVSDIRESILVNLKKRFHQAGIKRYKTKVVDLSASSLNDPLKFDLVICDAPCSGSGTWSRTPEQLYFFNEKKISEYSILQKNIVGNALKSLKKDGYFLYITCSVFKNENEEIVQFMEGHFKLKLIGSGYLKGYHQKADTLFTALFIL